MLAPRATRLSLLALLALLTLSGLAAQPAAAAKKPKACKAGQATLKVGKKTTCVKPAKAAAAATLDRLAASQLRQRVAKLPKRHRKAFSAKATAKLRAIADRQLQQRATAARVRAARLPVARTAAAGPSGCAGQPDRTTTGETTQQDGASVTPSASAWDGNGMSSGSLATATIVKGPLTYTKEEKKCVAWDGCPDADGILHGTYEWSERETYVGKIGGDVVKQHSVMSISAELTAHVGDDARVKTYDYAMDGVMEFGGEVRQQGKRLQHVPTQVFRIRASRAGLDPRVEDSDGWANASGVARGPKGDRIPAPFLKGLVSLVQLAEVYLQDQASTALLNSEHHFNDEAACLPVTTSPGSSKAEPSQRVPVEVTIKDTKGAELALPFKVAVAAGSTDPTSATSKATVNWTAPEDRKQAAGGFTVTHTSKRGVARGSFDAAWADKPPKFVLALEFSSKYSWEYTHDHESNVGTDSECVTHIKGNGFQQLFLDTIAYDEGGTAELYEGTFPLFTVKPLTGTMTRSGQVNTTRTGPASYCQPASSTAPTDGCVSVFSKDTPAYLSWQQDGSVKLELSNWREPDFPGDCPLWTPDYGNEPLHPDLDATSLSTTKLSLADLKDPSKKVLTVKGELYGRGHEDCVSEGNGGCGDDPKTSRVRYAIDAWSELEWTLTLKRVEG